MHRWMPSSIYEAKPWLLIVVGVALVASMTAWSLSLGYWSITRSLLTLLGAGLAIGGGAVLQLRQDYRARSKWRRDGMS